MPDVSYNYGYGKYESLSILITSTFSLFVLGFTFYEAVRSSGGNEILGNHGLMICFSIFSFIIMNRLAKILNSYSLNYNISILRFDADLWKNDSNLELGILINLVIGYVLSYNGLEEPAKIIDSIAAVLLIFYSFKTPLLHGKNALNQLLDRTLPESVQYGIISVIAENISNMCEFKTVHTRQSGNDLFIEIDLIMPYDYTLEQAYNLEKEILTGIRKLYPNSKTRLYAIPCNRDCIHARGSCPVKLQPKK
jgi:divalent metal cation (Fe/Co/Zn/Cd) transporter